MPRPTVSAISALGLLAGLCATASAGTATFTPTADAHVMSDAPTSNFATSTRPAVDGSPVANAMLRFQTSGLSGVVTSAKLRLYVNNPSDDGPAVYRSTGAWTESGVTWNNRPLPVGAKYGDLGLINTATWIEYDVTAAIPGNGTFDFVVTSTSADGMTFHSREDAQRPQLIVVTGSNTPTPAPTPTPSPTPAPTPTPTPAPAPSGSVDVTLAPAPGVSGTQRVNFAVPFAPGQLANGNLIRVLDGSVEQPTALRVLARHADGSARSVQIQLDTTIGTGKVLRVTFGQAPTTSRLTMAAVSTTLVTADGLAGPRVWARLPASWLSASRVAGPQVPEAQTTGAAAGAWNNVCDYQNHSITQFLPTQSTKDVWLFDRGTAMYRGYARRGDQLTLESAYRETALYRNGITGTGTSTRISVPSAVDDLKYHYNQNLAIHYLLTGDDRFREAAENIAIRAHALWSNPDYAGGADFWTERHAGFALLTYVWADIVTDDHGTEFEELADDAVDAYLEMQNRFPANWTDSAARCFAHTAEAHGEGYGTWGCSPWMAAILADGLDAYATERGGPDATAAWTAVVKLGKILARDGRDSTGKPFYWMGIGSAADQVDPDNEHWGEVAYIVAMAWHRGGRTDASLKTAADALLAGLKSRGTSPHIRSFNWQCRSAIAAPAYLQ